MNKKVKPSILAGFMELLPREQLIFNDILSKIIKVYEQNGFMPMDTPVIEKEEVLLAKAGGETEKQIYRFNKGNTPLALRFDLTVPLARFVAQYMGELTFPFKRYQIGKVYRGEKSQKSRYREFYQCDLDIIGNKELSIGNDALLISTITSVFNEIGLKGFKFLLSNRKIISGLLEELDIKEKADVFRVIDRYDKVGKDRFLQLLYNVVGEEKANVINEIISFKGTNKELISKLKNIDIENETFKAGICEIEEMILYLELFKICEEYYKIDLKIIRGLDYYTGSVFETVLEGYEKYGSICSGGRYNNLAQYYTDKNLPGVGISIGLTRLFSILKEIGFIDNYECILVTDVLIVPIGDTINYCSKVWKLLQDNGIKSEIYFEEGKLKKKLSYANTLNIKNVIIIGEDECSKGKIIYKNMVSGAQETIELEDLLLKFQNEKVMLK
ncbi:histidine--tRNA ligase [Tepidibacter hydrothermalis]|uniref:Histidine--tRNA ligase n=1 Tax=Tepidibacter hydrothermalis TaxID=3036126 RepID=A0ABY8EJ81_9FIRM|nr:histidine--tRNA ligase [Tepidibacter hydrothermalis]WFD11824.1 histidine--tRNA ligase [Tepidibacter hydrothermalis]